MGILIFVVILAVAMNGGLLGSLSKLGSFIFELLEKISPENDEDRNV